MIGAPEKFACVALTVDDNLGPFMGAAVIQNMDVVGFVAHLDDGLVPDLRGEIIALIRRLAFVSNKHPSIGKDVLHFQRVDVFVDINVAVYLIDLYKVSGGGWVIFVICHFYDSLNIQNQPRRFCAAYTYLHDVACIAFSLC